MDKKKLILLIITIFLFFICAILSSIVIKSYMIKKNFEDEMLSFANKNGNQIFTIDNVYFFSSCDSKNKTSSSSHFTIENLYQYTDIALFINSPSSEKTLENTLKKVYINNIKFDAPPLLGKPNLYFKSIEKFANSEIVEDNLIQDNLEFSITSENSADLSTPVLYNNLANPISLSYINQNIKTDYTITDTLSPITYDGSLLKRCSILINSISCKLSFDVYIVNNLDQEFKTTVFLNIPLETDTTSIYDGKITKTENINSIFYRYK